MHRSVDMGQERNVEQVRIAVFDAEPMARLWEQRLRQDEIPCLVKSLGAGSGAWGGSSFVPCGLYVLAPDRDRASDLLRQAGLAGDLLEPAPGEATLRRGDGWGRSFVFAVVAVVVMAVLASLLATNR